MYISLCIEVSGARQLAEAICFIYHIMIWQSRRDRPESSGRNTVCNFRCWVVDATCISFEAGMHSHQCRDIRNCCEMQQPGDLDASSASQLEVQDEPRSGQSMCHKLLSGRRTRGNRVSVCCTRHRPSSLSTFHPSLPFPTSCFPSDPLFSYRGLSAAHSSLSDSLHRWCTSNTSRVNSTTARCTRSPRPRSSTAM